MEHQIHAFAIYLLLVLETKANFPGAVHAFCYRVDPATELHHLLPEPTSLGECGAAGGSRWEEHEMTPFGDWVPLRDCRPVASIATDDPDGYVCATELKVFEPGEGFSSIEEALAAATTTLRPPPAERCSGRYFRWMRVASGELRCVKYPLWRNGTIESYCYDDDGDVLGNAEGLADCGLIGGAAYIDQFMNNDGVWEIAFRCIIESVDVSTDPSEPPSIACKVDAESNIVSVATAASSGSGGLTRAAEESGSFPGRRRGCRGRRRRWAVVRGTLRCVVVRRRDFSGRSSNLSDGGNINSNVFFPQELS